MLVTVAICTLNRAESLRRTRESLAAMDVPDDLGWEIVVVNNNGTDHTDAVIKDFGGRLPVRRAFEAQRGLSHARNRAVDTASGDYIVWTDDDVVVDPGWLVAYAEAFRRWPEAAVFGGPIIPRYVAPVPKWIIECEALVGGAFGIREFGNDPLPLSISEGRLPFGANYAVRAAEQRACRYDPNLGVRPGRRLLGEETDVLERILKSGASGYWVPAARIEHCIRHDMQTIGFVARHTAGWGETVAFQRGKLPATLWFGAPRWAWRQLIEGWLGYHIHRRISPAPVWMRHLQAWALAWGAIRYWRNERG